VYVSATGVLQQVGGKFGDDDRDLVDARAGQSDAAGQIAYHPTGPGYLTRFGDGGEHARSNAPA
jgi:hypothetical protein